MITFSLTAMQIVAIIGATFLLFGILTYYRMRKWAPAPVDPDQAIIDQLRELSDGLIYVSESEHPFEVVRVERPSYLFTAFEIYRNLEWVRLDEFFRNHTNPEYHYQAPHFIRLQNYIESTLEDVKVSRTGKIEITAYILGKAPSGNYVGLKTTIIET